MICTNLPQDLDQTVISGIAPEATVFLKRLAQSIQQNWNSPMRLLWAISDESFGFNCLKPPS